MNGERLYVSDGQSITDKFVPTHCELLSPALLDELAVVVCIGTLRLNDCRNGNWSNWGRIRITQFSYM